MAIYKLEIKQQYGKLSRRVYALNKAAPDYGGSYASIQEILGTLDTDLADAGVGTGDGVVFRNIEYGDLGELRGAVLNAPY